MEQQPVKINNENRGSLYSSLVCSPWLWLTILCILTILAYSNSLDVPFIFDDIDNIANNHYIRFQKITVKNIQDLAKSPLHGKRPVALFSFALNYYFDKYNVIGYHIVNILIHILNGLLLFMLIKKTLFLEYVRHSCLTRFSDRPASSSNSSTFTSHISDAGWPALEHSRTSYIALFATGLWLLNPVQIFSVTYTVQRMNSLSAMFSLLCILAYIKARSRRSEVPSPSRFAELRRAGGGQISEAGDHKSEVRNQESECLTDSRPNGLTKLRAYCTTIFFAFLSLLFAICAIASKQNALLLPLFIILYDLFFLSDLNFKSGLKLLRKPKFILRFLFIIIPIIAGFLFIVYYNTAANPWKHILSLYHGRDFTPLERMLTQPRVLCHYLSLIFYPTPSRMALLIDIPKSTGLLHPVSTLISILFLSLLLLIALFTAKRYRLFSFAILWFFIGQLLESTIIPVEQVYIHRNYLPSMFLFLPIVAWMIKRHGARSMEHGEEGSIGKGVGSQPAGILEIQDGAGKRSEVPSSSRSAELRRAGGDQMSEVTSESRITTHGSTDLLTHGLTDSRFSLNISLVLLSVILLLFTYWTYSYNRVWATDVAFWEDNVKKSPALPRTHANYGAVLIKSGNYHKAHEALQQTLNLKPNDTRTLYNIGVAYEQEKKYNEAITYYSKALRQNGNFADAWRNQGSLLIELGDLENGLNCLNAAWKRQPFEPITNYEFGHALVLKKHFKRAHFHLIRAIECDPDYVDPILELGLLYNLIDDHKMAKMFFKKAIELDPNNLLAKEFLKISENALNK